MSRQQFEISIDFPRQLAPALRNGSQLAMIISEAVKASGRKRIITHHVVGIVEGSDEIHDT